MNDTRDYGIALLRVTLGGLILSHGLVKLFVFTPAGTVGFFASLGLPAIAAYATMALEVGGGLALIAGLFVRPIALLQAVLLLGTIVTVHGVPCMAMRYWPVAVRMGTFGVTGPGEVPLTPPFGIGPPFGETLPGSSMAI